ncbi:MAG: phosphotransferase, partial [Novosphingobium sp.]
LRDVTFMSLQAPIGFDLARRFLTQMAGMHARWWEADGLKARFPWMNYADSVQVDHYYNIMANEKEFNSFVSAPRGAAMPRKLLNADLLRQAHEKMQTFHRRMPQTVNHGDTHLGNLYVNADGNPGFLDYQPCIGPWCVDVSYFMIAGIDLLDRQRWQGALLQHYLDALAAHGVTPPSFDDAWLAYRQSVPWGLLIWMLNGSNFQTEANNTAAATRFAMAMVDLDTFAALDLEMTGRTTFADDRSKVTSRGDKLS